MSFIRIKEIGKKGRKYRYAYLVSNKWRKRLKGGMRGSRQKVAKYLGKVITLEKEKDTGFFEFINIKDNPKYLENSKEKIVMDLVRYELCVRGFNERDGSMEKEGIKFELKGKRFIDHEGVEEKMVIEMNEGFLCKYTVASVINFKKQSDDEHFIGVSLAKAFLEAGLNVPKEIFVGYFEKV